MEKRQFAIGVIKQLIPIMDNIELEGMDILNTAIK